MEIAILAGMAILGNELTKTSKLKNKINEKPIRKEGNQYPFQGNKENPADFKYNQFQPFFQREGGMSLSNNNEIKTRTLEGFTGINNSDFQYKKEQSCLFKPEENIQNIYGAPAIPDDLQKRYQASSLMNNVAPIAKQQVGPGLNVDDDVDAKGGFHQYFRVLPNNVGVHNKNTLQARTVAGKSMTENSTLPTEINSYKPKTYFDQCDHPTMPTKHVINAPTTQSEFDMKLNNRGASNQHAGIAKGTTGHSSSINGTRVGSIPLQSLPTGGASMENAATGGYAVSKYLVHESDRENCGDVTNAHNNSGNYVKGKQMANMTQREGTSKGYSGNAGFYNEAQSNYSTAYNANQYYNRENLQVDHTPNPGNMNIRENANSIMGSVKVREDCNGNRPSNGMLPNSMNVQGKPGHIEHAPKISECNPRQDFGLASQILKNNPYAVH